MQTSDSFKSLLHGNDTQHIHEEAQVGDALREVVRAFQADVQRALSLFREHRNAEGVYAWRRLGFEQTGHIDTEKRYPYFFHGIGCCVHLDRTTHIDWDFGHEGRADGFDLWRLRKFLEERPLLQASLPLSALEALFDAAVRNGSIVSPWRAHSDYLYYLPEDVGFSHTSLPVEDQQSDKP